MLFRSVIAELQQNVATEADKAYWQARLDGTRAGTIAFVTFHNHAQEPKSVPGVHEGRQGDWVLNAWSVFYGSQTQGKVIIARTPYFDTDFDYGDVWRQISNPAVIIPIILKKVAGWLCGDFADLAAKAATAAGYPAVEAGYKIGCILGGDGEWTPTQPSSDATPWIIAGGAAVVLGGLGYLALRKKKRST